MKEWFLALNHKLLGMLENSIISWKPKRKADSRNNTHVSHMKSSHKVLKKIEKSMREYEKILILFENCF